MDSKEIIKRSIRGFFIIFTMGNIGFTAFSWFLSPRRTEGLFYGDFVMLLFISFITSQAYWIFYSKDELTEKQFTIRHIAHFMFVQGTALTGLTLTFYGRGFQWGVSPWIGVTMIFLCVCVTYVTVMFVDSFSLKKLTDDINRKLQERNRG